MHPITCIASHASCTMHTLSPFVPRNLIIVLNEPVCVPRFQITLSRTPCSSELAHPPLRGCRLRFTGGYAPPAMTVFSTDCGAATAQIPSVALASTVRPLSDTVRGAPFSGSEPVAVP
eukprot:gb/GEZJ01005762.1/.p1 GENE.gb/GEZJ01005762.1/~~gb/GEZJ01005762.1/.p1  ORF type:complete len:134 (+),score=8.92 gb/GEZJ01005762.1/:51-404(+)